MVYVLLLKFTNKTPNIKTTIIYRNTYHYFTPFLHEAAIDSIHSDHIKRPLRKLFGGEKVEFHQGEINKADLN